MNHRAFSLIEVLSSVAVAGLLSSIAFVSVGEVSQRSTRKKLEADVDTLNRAVSSYLVMGGSLDGVESPAEVIAHLKSTSSPEAAKQMPGLSSSFVDPRLGVSLSADGKGVVWDADHARLILDGTGPGAVAAFTLDDSLAEATPAVETRKRLVSYAKESTWVWDYHDRPVIHETGATEFVVAKAPETQGGGFPAATPAPDPRRTLISPQFSYPGGSYDIRDYDLPVTLTNPNPQGTSRIVYAIDYGSWREYHGPVMISPGSVLSAQALSAHSQWGDSAKHDEQYGAVPAALAAPGIESSHTSFGMFYNREIEVTISNPNSEAHSRLEYRINEGGWQSYDAPFTLDRGDFPNAATIEARALPVGSPYYLESPVASRSIALDPFEASGSAAGEFSNASGTSRMVSSLGSGETGETFAWGEQLPVNDSNRTEQSRLAFGGSEFSQIAPGNSFRIGSLSYYNGTIRSGTGADRIDLTLKLDLSINGILFQPNYAFSFDLINTTNTDDAWESADYVRIADPISRRRLVINQYEYDFNIEFGRTTSLGFSHFNEFHVFEDAWASSEIYGSLVEVGRVRD
ncbi:MAG: choice-of-anchor K domain-containing protein [Verrucomicrobiae bacterium]|nr:choice-of-anchor K domain-containing protein [Verrucomicrobiae bacterium]